VTLLRLLRSHVPEKMFSANSKKTKTAERKTELSFSRTDYASVHDSLLTLYHGVRLYHRATDSCQWAGADQILPTLRKVPAAHTNTHTHTHPFNGSLSGTTRVSRYQKRKTSLDFTEARDSEWQWHQPGRGQVLPPNQQYQSTVGKVLKPRQHGALQILYYFFVLPAVLARKLDV